jgi:hypothetical protein
VFVRRHRGRGVLHFGVSIDLRVSCSARRPVGEEGSVGLVVVTAPLTVNILHSLEVLGDLAGVHAAPADSVLVGEHLSKDYAWTDGIISWYWDLGLGVGWRVLLESGVQTGRL